MAVAALMLPLLASCGSDGDCWNCQPSATEVSLGLVAADFSHSGATSIVATSTVLQYPQYNPGNLDVHLASAPGRFAAPVQIADGNDPAYLATADFNGDGLPDVASASYDDGQISVFLNEAQTPGTFADPLILSSPDVSQLAAADMNGDGVPDIAVTDSAGVKVLMHVGAAGTTSYAAPVAVFTQTPNTYVSGANLVAIADVNGDGLNDLVITDPGPTGCGAPTVSILLQNATHPGQFLAPVAYPLGGCNPAESIVVMDVNDDGHPDIIIGGENGVTVLVQNAASPGTFLPATTYLAPNANEIAVADVNLDGYPDIIVPTGLPQSVINGVQGNAPGALLQNSGSPGTFAAMP